MCGSVCRKVTTSERKLVFREVCSSWYINEEKQGSDPPQNQDCGYF